MFWTNLVTRKTVSYIVFSFLITNIGNVLAITVDEAKREIPEVYESYVQALLSSNGNAAIPLVTQGTLDYYGEMRDLALYASEEKVRALPWVDKAVVLRLRHEINPMVLKNMTSKELFALGISEGWTDPRGMQGTVIRDVEINNRVGYGIAYKNKQKIPLRFKKESEKWKFDAIYLIRTIGLAADEQVKKLAEQNDMTLDELTIQLTEGASGKPVTENLWVPLLKK